MSSTTELGYPIWDPVGDDLNENVYSYLNSITGAQSTSAMRLLTADLNALNNTKLTIYAKTASDWTADTTTVIKSGEFGIESDTGKIKFGNGIDTWASLIYFSSFETLSGTEDPSSYISGVIGQTYINTSSSSIWLCVAELPTTWLKLYPQGDMSKSVYDTDNSGTVDNSERLGGELPSYYAADADIPTVLSALAGDSTHRLVSDTEKSTWNGKQDVLSGDVETHHHTSDRNRENHSGTQTASTISDFADAVRGAVLTGFSSAVNAVIEATDSILTALGKLQAQITAHKNDMGNPHELTLTDIGAAAASQALTGTLLSTGWTGGVQTVSVTGVTAASNGTIGLPTTATAEQRTAARAAQLVLTGQAAGVITVTADGTVPVIDIPIAVLIVG